VRATEVDDQGQPRVNVEVQDTGPGFSQDVADKMGEPFQSTRSVGLGLGLTVTRKIIENHSGRIDIPRTDKAPGIIRISLPIGDGLSN
jgi:two-component system sensor kinase FixL